MMRRIDETERVILFTEVDNPFPRKNHAVSGSAALDENLNSSPRVGLTLEDWR